MPKYNYHIQAGFFANEHFQSQLWRSTPSFYNGTQLQLHYIGRLEHWDDDFRELFELTGYTKTLRLKNCKKYTPSSINIHTKYWKTNTYKNGSNEQVVCKKNGPKYIDLFSIS